MERALPDWENRTHRVLVVDDEPDIAAILSDFLLEHGHLVETAADGREAWEKCRAEPFDLVVTDLKMPQMGGLELLRNIQDAGQPSLVVIMTGYATVETAVEALKIGAFDYILKPFKITELLQIVERAFERIRLEAENLHLKEQVALLRLSEAVASSLSLDEVLSLVVEAALKEVDADGVELLFRPSGSASFTRRVSCGREGPMAPVLGDVEGLEAALKSLPHLQLAGEELAPLLSPAATSMGRLLSVPLRRGGEVLGVLNAYSRRARRGFLPREEKALFVLGDRAATSLENALLYSNLENTFRQTIEGLALALETKDPYTRGHAESVTRLCDATARAMGLDEAFCGTLRQAAILHDIGKIGIAGGILNKPEGLTADEYEVIKSHPRMGKRILGPISFLQEVVPAVYHHHERWDGGGYPEGLQGDETPLGARIMQVADTYDAMTSDRAYRRALSHETAVAELRRCAGSQLDGKCVEAFLSVHGRKAEEGE
ncbi:MAG: response regulator [Deltaproteobacteria bacterium]|nr:response regulator [Deltaproteobacteria bacterium]